MNFKSQIPFFTVPLALVVLSTLSIGAMYGRFDPSVDIGRFVFLGLGGIYWLITGLIHWNKPYVATDDKGLTVYGRHFSNQPTKKVPWDLMRGHASRTFGDIRFEISDGQTIKIPINGMSGKAVTELLALIEENGIMRTTRSPSPRSPSVQEVGER